MMCVAMTLLLGVSIGVQGEAAKPPVNPDVILPGRVLADGTQGNPDDVVFKVDTTAVTRREWAELVNFRRRTFPQRSLVDILVSSVHDLARLKAVENHFAQRAQEMQPKLEELKAKIADLEKAAGGDKKALLDGFGQLCNQYSDDPTLRGFGRDGRVGNIMHGQTHYPFDICVFERFPPGKISEPVATLHGYEIFLVEEIKKGAAPVYDVGITRRLLLQWDRSDRKVAKRADYLLARSKLEIVDAAFKQIVPPGLLLGPGDKPFDFKLAGSSDADPEATEPCGGSDQDKTTGGGKDGGGR